MSTSEGSLSDADFDLASNSFSVLRLRIAAPATDNVLQLALNPPPGGLTGDLTLHLGSDSFPLADATVLADVTLASLAQGGTLFTWTGHGLSWSASDTVAARLTHSPPPPVVPCPGAEDCFEILASSDLVPPGISAGSSFRLLFVSSTTRDATSTDIADYNTFVQAAAARGPPDIHPYHPHFTAVGSTADDDARDNTSTTYTAANKGLPIHWLGGDKVADDYEDFYDGTWDDEANPKNESGSAQAVLNSSMNPNVFTGTTDSGTQHFSAYLGSTVFTDAGIPNADIAWVGRLDSDDGDPLDGATGLSTGNHGRFYALSPVLKAVTRYNDAHVPANWALIPDGLGPGDSFRLLFATSTTRDATSTDIADYNTFVQTAAAAGHVAIQPYSLLFRAVGSTAAVDARDNTGTTHTATDLGLPIYWLNGEKVADQYKDFYDGDWDEEADSTDESGSIQSLSANADWPFTGSDDDGTAFSLQELGSTANSVRVGRPNSIASGANPLSSGSSQVATGSRRFYALSGIFIVGQEITVPSNWGLIPDGLGPGDRFRLLFASSNSNNADDTGIAAYNTWVQARAAAGHAGIRAYSDGFRVVGSTAAVDAIDNTQTNYTDDDKGLPIYWLNGSKVADDYEDFYDGDWDDEAGSNDASGNARTLSGTSRPHTGSGHDGTEAFTGSNSRALGATLVRIGWPNSSGASDGPLSFVSTTSGDVNKFGIRPFYALSEVLEVSPHGVANNAPAFTATPPVTRDLAENTAAGENVGAPVAASDDDTGDALTYSLGGTDAASFEIVTTSGQIQTKAEVSYDHETKSSYSVDVRVTDGLATATIAVTITVTDVAEPPAAPAAPAVLPTAGTTDSLDVSWTAPDNTGPAITDYDVEYRAVGGAITDLNHTGTALSATIGGLDPATHYQVQVRATNAEGTGEWSDPGQGPTRGPPTEVPVHWGLIPDGLGPGDSFRLLFLSSTKRDATSPDINVYNAFAQARAAAGHADIQAYSAGFAAVGSTAAVDARVNSASTFDAMSDDKGPPIYWLGGNQVADDYADFYDGDWDDEANPTNESGSAEPAVNNVGNPEGIFTGSEDDGTASPQEYLGTTEPSIAFSEQAGFATVGLLDSNLGDPLDGGSSNSVETGNSLRFYALSPVFVVAPEAAVPADWGLLPDGLGPGDRFRLLFATSTTRDATATGIGVYNTFVQNAAASGHADIQAYSYLFRVVGSTAAVDARDNTSTTYTSPDTGHPIYWLGGNKAADGYPDFYDLTWDDEANPTDESGNARSLSGASRPFTGSNNNGTAESSNPLGANQVSYGTLSSAIAGRNPLKTTGESFPNTDTRPFYALSPVFVVTSDVTVPPDWGLIPEGLAAGDKFRLLFLSDGTIAGTDTDIAVYNTFVQDAAAAGHAAIQDYSAGFRAVGSTTTVDAIDNTETTHTSFDKGPPIYWLNGAKVADQYEDFYDGSWDDENPKDESGSDRSLSSLDYPWTGSNDDGTEASEFFTSKALGSIAGIPDFGVEIGPLGSAAAGENPLSGDSSIRPGIVRPLYALSQVFTVGTEIPVPSNWSLNPTGLTTGDRFRLLFLSSTTRNATSSDIADYNTHVQNAAAAGDADIQDYSSWFRAVASTPSTDARDNTATTGTGVPIYWLGGTKAADDYAGFYDGGWDDEANAKDESGSARSTSGSADYPWTGSSHSGTESSESGFSVALGASPTSLRVGRPNSGDPPDGPLSSNEVRDKSLTGPVYGLSPVFAVISETVAVNAAPVFSDTAPVTRSVAENTVAGEDVGAAVAADDTDMLTYSLGGTDAASFDIVSTSGQIQTKAALDHETTPSYSVNVSVTDGTATVTIAVAISVTDVAEPPDAPDAPTVLPTAGTTDSLDASWTAPDNTGPAITDYDVQYRAAGEGTWTDGNHSGTALSATLAALDADTAYEVQVRATNEEGTGGWSDPGRAATHPPETEVPADWPLIPDGLAAGDRFRLLFATSTTSTATSADISDYNSFVQTAAAAGHAAIQAYSAGFRAVGSTAAFDARDNTASTGTGHPIHWLGGNKAADGYPDFYDGSWDEEANPTDESGSARTINTQATWPFTGSVHNGTEAFSGGNSRALGAATIRVGRPNSTGSGDGPLGGGASIGQPGDTRPFYALSPVFTVSSEVTVPSNWGLIPDGLAAGTKFRLLFATSTSATATENRDASSTDIADYNSFVQGRAAAGHADIQAYSAGFRAVGSTAAVDARDNTATTFTATDKGVPIYWLGGAKVADEYEDFYDETWDDEANSKDESGSARPLSGSDRPFTGSNHDGTENLVSGNSRALGTSTVRQGRPNSGGANAGPLSSNNSAASGSTGPFYALSPVFVVGTEITVPSNWGLIPTGLTTGARFRLLFVTYAGEDPTSTDIGDYNTYVQSQANASNAHTAIKAHSSHFRVVGSTAGTDARDNTATTTTDDDTGVPVYWLNGAQVADDYADFYDGSWDDETNPRERTGSVATTDVDRIWSGSTSDGQEKFNSSSVSRAFGASLVGTGRLNASGDGPLDSDEGYSTSTNYRYYALSGVFAVGSQAAAVNALPVFGDTAPVTRSVAENTDAGENVGAPVAATDTDTTDMLTYSLGGTDAASFDIVSTSGQIQTKTALDHETKDSYSVDVSVTDGAATVTVAVAIAVTDVNEPPTKPAAPVVAPGVGGSRTLFVTWTASSDNGGPPVGGYRLRYRKATAADWTRWPQLAVHPLTSETITGLDAATAYDVQVQAYNAEANSDWSDTGTATTAAPPPAGYPLVSNLSESAPSGVGIRDSRQLATAFTTGSHPGGYVIHSVSLDLTRPPNRPAASAIAVTIRADSSGSPGDTLITLTQPAGTVGVTAGTLKVAFSAPAGSTLAAETTYFVVAAPETGSLTVSHAEGDGDASDFGWSIADGSRYASTGSDWADRTYSMSMRVDGLPAPAVLPPDSALIPAGLAAGARFRLLFATSTSATASENRDASSTDIADYNSFVQGRAAAGHDDIQAYSAGFRVVGSTTAVDARDNTATTTTGDDTGLPIYWLGGAKVADNYAEFYDGSWDDEANPKDESGSARPLSADADRPFTGSDDDGTADSSSTLGSGTVTIGKPNSSVANENPLSSDSAQANTETRPFYALSHVFEVGTEITVPSNWGLIPTGLTTGARFRLLFVTYAGEDPTSTDIATYNTYIQSQANASNAHTAIKAHSSHFRVVGSTAGTDARDNTATTDDDTGVPVYWLNGAKVADDYAGFYDGSWDDETNPRERTGSVATTDVDRIWTGSTSDGQEKFNSSSVSRAFGASLVGTGRLNASGVGPLDSDEAYSTSTNYRYYALSGVFAIGSQAAAVNALPVFTDTAPVTRSVAENTDAGENVGTPVAATDTDTGDMLTYSLGGTDAASFDIDTSTGQIQTKAALNHEATQSYSVDVSVTDGTATVTLAVTVTVTDVAEPPAAPAAPTVLPTAGTDASLDVSWTAPANTGPAITDYDVQYQAVGSGTWIDGNHSGTALSATLGGLDPGTHYQVQVRATNAEGTGGWSDPGQAPTRGPPTEVPADWGLVPDGLGPGDTFRLLFATSATRDATSTDISDYNSFVQEAAAAGQASIRAYSAGFAVVGSTAAVDARDNTASRFDPMSDDKGPPIHWLGGNQVADDYADFYDGSWDDEANATDESGSARSISSGSDRPYTGSKHDGTEFFSGTNDSLALGQSGSGIAVVIARPNDDDAGSGPLSSNSGDQNISNPRPFYALSEVFTVSSEVTVPGNWALNPDGLGPGDKFRLLFATSTSATASENSDASSTDIADYNSFVQGRAAGGHTAIQAYSAFFRAVGSTAAVDARDNTGTTHTATDKGVPIYWLGGSKVADQYEDFYDGSWDDEVNSTDESGIARPLSGSDRPFTGSEDDGTAFASRQLGASNVQIGEPNSPSGDPLDGQSALGNSSTRPFYALSPVFEVGTEITVPPDWGLIPTGLSSGERFRLLFIPSTATDASSDDIGVYNTLVQTAAAAGHAAIQDYSASFRVVGSTEAVDARDNTATTGTGVPIYWLNGAKVADDYADFYDGDWDNEINGRRASGASVTLSSSWEVWTGSAHDGTAAVASGPPPSSRALGNGGSTGTNSVQEGRPASAGHGPLSGTASPRTEMKGVYALSGVFAAGTQAVVPASTALVLSVNPTSVAENGVAATVTVTATLNGAARAVATGVTVSEVAGGTATSGEDYTAVSTLVLTIPAQQTSASGTFAFTPMNDSTAEGAETVKLSAGATGTGLAAGTAELTITDDDTASTGFTLGVEPASVAENAVATTVTVTATLNAGARTTATEVTVSRTGGTGTSGTDYTAISNFTLTIAATETSGTGTFTFTPSDNSVAGGNKTVILSGAATGLTTGTATLTITDDETASTAIELSVSPASVAEDAAATTVTVTAALNAGGADGGDDGDGERRTGGTADGGLGDGLHGDQQLHADDRGDRDERDGDVHVHAERQQRGGGQQDGDPERGRAGPDGRHGDADDHRRRDGGDGVRAEREPGERGRGRSGDDGDGDGGAERGGADDGDDGDGERRGDGDGGRRGRTTRR